MKKFRVLMLYPNGKLMNPPPISIGIFTALLKQNSFEVALFDSTLYENLDDTGSDTAKQQNLQVRPFDWGSRSVALKKNRMEDDLIRIIDEFRPDLITISILECTYAIARRMLQAIENCDIPLVAGGIFATFAPEIVFQNKKVDVICVGEGERALVEVCKCIVTKSDYYEVENLCFKRNGQIIQNKLGLPIIFDELPMPDYSLFEPIRFFRPMAGKVYKTIPIETNRGCPYTCTFCNSPSTFKLYRENNRNYFRKKSISRIKDELQYLINEWDAEYVYFTSDNSLLSSESEFDAFIEMYREIKLPFWMQFRPENITRVKMQKLKEVGCHRLSVGLEHGNADFRKNVLKKNFDNEKMLAASQIIAEVGIPLTVNNMIGFPDETRELIFDTIELNRKLIFDTTNCAAFSPFHGTPLQKLCVEKGYISDDFIFGSINIDVPLDMPQLSREEIKGLRRTFALYARMPKKFWSQIERAEKFDEEGNRVFNELSKIYQDNFFESNRTSDEQ